MPTKKSVRPDMTPAGRLEEAGLHQVLGYQLKQAAIVTDAIYQRHVGQPFGLRPVEYTVLTLIDENPGGSLVRIARALAVTPPNISTMVERLEAQGWIVRTQSNEDRRTQVLHTTAKGASMTRKATQLILEAEKGAVGLTAAEQAMLVELLHKVARARTAADPG